MLVSSGSTEPALPATSANSQMSLFARKPFSQDTQSTAPSSNTVSPRLLTLPAFPRNVLLMPLLRFSALVLPSTRA